MLHNLKCKLLSGRWENCNQPTIDEKRILVSLELTGYDIDKIDEMHPELFENDLSNYPFLVEEFNHIIEKEIIRRSTLIGPNAHLPNNFSHDLIRKLNFTNVIVQFSKDIPNLLNIYLHFGPSLVCVVSTDGCCDSIYKKILKFYIKHEYLPHKLFTDLLHKKHCIIEFDNKQSQLKNSYDNLFIS